MEQVEKIKINSYHRKISSFIQLLVSVISHYSQRFAADFLQIFLIFIEKTTFEELNEIYEQIHRK